MQNLNLPVSISTVKNYVTQYCYFKKDRHSGRNISFVLHSNGIQAFCDNPNCRKLKNRLEDDGYGKQKETGFYSFDGLPISLSISTLFLPNSKSLKRKSGSEQKNPLSIIVEKHYPFNEKRLTEKHSNLSLFEISQNSTRDAYFRLCTLTYPALARHFQTNKVLNEFDTLFSNAQANQNVAEETHENQTSKKSKTAKKPKAARNEPKQYIDDNGNLVKY